MRKIMGIGIAALLLVNAVGATAAADVAGEEFAQRVAFGGRFIDPETREIVFAEMVGYVENGYADLPAVIPYSAFYFGVEAALPAGQPKFREAAWRELRKTGSGAGPLTTLRAREMLLWSLQDVKADADEVLPALHAHRAAFFEADYVQPLAEADHHRIRLQKINLDEHMPMFSTAERDLAKSLLERLWNAKDRYGEMREASYREVPKVKELLGEDYTAGRPVKDGDGFDILDIRPRAGCEADGDAVCPVTCGEPAYRAWIRQEKRLGDVKLSEALSGWFPHAIVKVRRTSFGEGVDFDFSPGSFRLGDVYVEYTSYSNAFECDAHKVGNCENYIKVATTDLGHFLRQLDEAPILSTTYTLVGLSRHETDCGGSGVIVSGTLEMRRDIRPRLRAQPSQVWGEMGELAEETW